MYIKRKLEKTILRYLKNPEILAVVGPRQSGKTTLLKKIQINLKNSIFISFEDIDNLALFQHDIKRFAEKFLHHKYIFIDEFQYAKQGGKGLKFLFDTYPNCKIIISGSSAIDLTIKAIKFLVGRVFVFNLYGLDFEEYLSFRDPALLKIYASNKKHLNLKNLKTTNTEIDDNINRRLMHLAENFIIWGGYPQVAIVKSKEEKNVVLKNIYNTYFLRDIKDTLGLIDDYKLSKLIEALAIQIGQLVNYHELGQISGYDYLNLKKYLNILDKTFICQAIRPFFSNRRKEIAKNPKIYFFDTGLRNLIVQNFSPLKIRGDKGQLYENFIFTQLVKQDLAVNYWRDKKQSESDFVIKQGQELLPIESKGVVNKSRFPKSLANFIKQYHPANAIILSDSALPDVKLEKTLVHFLPRWII